jgi:hypothetical protein
MFDVAPPLSTSQPAASGLAKFEDLVEWLSSSTDYTIWITELGGSLGLNVVRVFIEGIVTPFSERSSPSERLNKMLKSADIRYPYFDPILT